jgi:uncharacterized protein YutE (UPF0331/DUF86 family)
MRLRNEERENLIRLIDFLESELQDYSPFQKMDWTAYQTSRDKRRNVERWIENIVNCSIDIAKILLVSEKKPIPETYKNILRDLGTMKCFGESFGKKISNWARLRNIITHEYLDFKWDSIEKFINKSKPVYQKLIKEVKSILLK